MKNLWSRVSWIFVLFFVTKIIAQTPPSQTDARKESGKKSSTKKSLATAWDKDIIKKIHKAARTPKPINLYGRQTTLQKLLDYQDVRNLDPQTAFSKYSMLLHWSSKKIASVSINEPESPSVRLKKMIGDIRYMKREFTPSSPKASAKLAVPIVIGDTPSTLGIELITQPGSFVVIKGPEGSGKTVALTKILDTARNNPTETWTVMLDATKIVDKPAIRTGGDFIRESMGSNAHFFQELMHQNPSKVKILIDNLDRTTYRIKNRVINYVTELSKSGVSVAIALRSDYYPLPNNKLEVEIPGLSIAETKTLFRRLWIQEFGVERSAQINDYVASIGHLLELNNILPIFPAQKELANIFAHGDKEIAFGKIQAGSIFVEEGKFISLEKYISSSQLEGSNPTKLMDQLRTTKFNKINLFEKLIESMPAHTFINRGRTAFYTLKDAMKLRTPTNSPVREEMKRVLNLIDVSPAESTQTYRLDVFSFFNEPGYDNYIMSRFLLKAFKNQLGNELQATLKFILEDSSCIKVAEFINSALNEPKYRHRLDSFFRKVVSQPNEWHAIMDNMLTHGQDSIASNLVKALSQVKSAPQSLREYFESEVGISKTLTSDTTFEMGFLHETSNKLTCTRQEMMFRKNMYDTIVKVDKLVGRDYWDFSEFGNYMKDFVLKQSNPNTKIYEFLRSQMSKKIPTQLANEMLFTAMSHSGLNNRYIIEDLVHNGANPKIINKNGKTLVHLALEQGDPALLHYVVKELQVPMRDMPNTKSLLITALDSNPVTRYSPPDFWATMSYLVKNGELEVPPRNHPEIGSTKVQPTPNEAKTIAYEVLMSASDVNLPDESLAEIRVAKSSTMQELTPEMRDLRRNLVLGTADNEINPSSLKPLTEILLKYRGTEQLSPTEQMFYRDAVISAINHDYRQGHHPTIQSQERIVQALFDSIYSTNDLHFANNVLNKLISRSNNREPLIKLIRTELDIISLVNREASSVPKPKTLVSKVLLSNEYENPTSRIAAFESLKATMQQRFPIFVCGSLRGRRRRRSPSCRLSKSDYEKFVKINEEGKPIINTDEYMGLLEQFQHQDLVKYEQLIELGKTMVVENDAQLIGDYKSQFEELTQPHKIDENAIDTQYNVPTDEIVKIMYEQRSIESPEQLTAGSRRIQELLNEGKPIVDLSKSGEKNPIMRTDNDPHESYPKSVKQSEVSGRGTNSKFGSIKEEPTGYGRESGKQPKFRPTLGTISEEHYGNVNQESANPLDTFTAFRESVIKPGENLRGSSKNPYESVFYKPTENLNGDIYKPVVSSVENLPSGIHESVVNPAENFNYHYDTVHSPVENVNTHYQPIHPVDSIHIADVHIPVTQLGEFSHPTAEFPKFKIGTLFGRG